MKKLRKKQRYVRVTHPSSKRCHEQIARQASKSHSQAAHIKEMTLKMDEFSASHHDLAQRSKLKHENYEHELIYRQEELGRLQAQLKIKEDAVRVLHQSQEELQAQNFRLQGELEQRNEELQELNAKLSQIENQMEELFLEKNSEGTVRLETEHLRKENRRLITSTSSFWQPCRCSSS